MKQDILNQFIETGESKLPLFFRKATIKLLLSLFVASCVFSLLACYIMIPSSSRAVNSGFITGVKVHYLFTFFLLFILPLVAFIPALLLSLIPFRKLKYRQKLVPVVISIATIFETYYGVFIVYEMLKDKWR